MEEMLIQAGLTQAQAAAYLYLLNHGPAAPPSIANALSLTRTNAYKILDALVEIELVRKNEVNKKLVYRATDPLALANLLAQERDRIVAVEQHVREAMHELRAAYEKNNAAHDVQTFQGSQAVKALYLSQAKASKPIYCLESSAASQALGRETIEAIRHIPSKQGTELYVTAPADHTAPVEWSVCGDELLIMNFADEPTAIRIHDAAAAESFRQLWQLIDESLEA